MSQMDANDLKVVRAIPGNDKCCDCGMKHPQWASVSFGNVFCLECSGVHRSLGVHISFVRSIAMDSWTPAQLKIMRAGGNDACNNYLHSKGVSKTASIKEKYDTDAAALYKEVIKARSEGRPEPTQLVKKPPKKKYVSPGASMPSAPSGGKDPNGMEKMAGESDAEYIARQTRLREQAKARMAAKFGNPNGGSRTMGGVGSTPHPSQGGGMGLDSFSDTLSSGFGTAASGLSSVFSLAKETVTSDSAKSVAKDMGSMGMGLWSSISSSAKEVANNLNVEGLNLGVGDDDGLSALNEKAKRERSTRSGSSMYAGFGSDARNVNGANMNGGRQPAAPVVVTAQNQNSAAPLPGESDAQFMQRQMKIREEAQATATTAQRMTNKSASASAPSKPAVAKMKVDADDDFFSSFGA